MTPFPFHFKNVTGLHVAGTAPPGGSDGSAAGRELMDSVQRPWSLCENLGATESIITCPSVMTHANMLAEDRMKVGITDGFVRVSVGLEETEDLIKSLKIALDKLVK